MPTNVWRLWILEGLPLRADCSRPSSSFYSGRSERSHAPDYFSTTSVRIKILFSFSFEPPSIIYLFITSQSFPFLSSPRPAPYLLVHKCFNSKLLIKNKICYEILTYTLKFIFAFDRFFVKKNKKSVEQIYFWRKLPDFDIRTFALLQKKLGNSWSPKKCSKLITKIRQVIVRKYIFNWPYKFYFREQLNLNQSDRKCRVRDRNHLLQEQMGWNESWSLF